LPMAGPAGLLLSAGLCVGLTALAARSRSKPFEGLIQVSRLPAVV
jgi:hypothetical protein